MVVIDKQILCFEYHKEGMRAKDIQKLTGINWQTVRSNIYKGKYKAMHLEYEKGLENGTIQPEVKFPNLTKERVDKENNGTKKHYLDCTFDDLSLIEKLYAEQIGFDKLDSLNYNKIKEHKKVIWL